MNFWSLWIFTTSFVLVVLSKDDIWERKIPMKFLKAVMDKSNLCEYGYGDYDSCENYVTTNRVKSHISNDMYEYNSEENVVANVEPVEKRSRAGCKCELKTTQIDLGMHSFPRHFKNVTCDGNQRCYHPLSKVLHCLPIHYQVDVITRRETTYGNSNDQSDTLPQGLGCCWKKKVVPIVIGCFCGQHN